MRRSKLKSLADASPERREELRRIAVRNLRTWHRENPEAAGEVSRGIALRSIAWCPPEFREERARLRKLVGAAEARRIIEERIPGTAAHAKLTVLNNATAMRLKHEREKASRY